MPLRWYNNKNLFYKKVILSFLHQIEILGIIENYLSESFNSYDELSTSRIFFSITSLNFQKQSFTIVLQKAVLKKSVHKNQRKTPVPDSLFKYSCKSKDCHLLKKDSKKDFFGNVWKKFSYILLT